MSLTEQIEALEHRLHQLLSVMEQMAAANETLQADEQALREECSRLRRKNEQAGLKIEAMLKTLKQYTGQARDEADE